MASGTQRSYADRRTRTRPRRRRFRDRRRRCQNHRQLDQRSANGRRRRPYRYVRRTGVLTVARPQSGIERSFRQHPLNDAILAEKPVIDRGRDMQRHEQKQHDRRPLVPFENLFREILVLLGYRRQRKAENIEVAAIGNSAIPDDGNGNQQRINQPVHEMADAGQRLGHRRIRPRRAARQTIGEPDQNQEKDREPDHLVPAIKETGDAVEHAFNGFAFVVHRRHFVAAVGHVEGDRKLDEDQKRDQPMQAARRRRVRRKLILRILGHDFRASQTLPEPSIEQTRTPVKAIAIRPFSLMLILRGML
ncbi:hypothetical protein HYPGJ_20933 [Hyphomicrobium sp. GJ21]|nr:hypothetical protein HYPGJ_20933 [Hyphomicrobium sp. GJ21]